MAAALRSVVYHVFLPPKLPSGEDDGSWVPTLVRLLLSSLRDFQTLQEDEAAGLVAKAIAGIENFQETQRASGETSELGLKNLLETINHKGTCDDQNSHQNTNLGLQADLSLCTLQPKTRASSFVRRRPT